MDQAKAPLVTSSDAMPDEAALAAAPPAMSVRSAAVWAMATQYLAFALQFITSVIISRFFLAPEEVGLFSIALAAALMLASLQDFGLTRYLSGHPSPTRDELRRCSSLSLMMSLGIFSLVAALAVPAAHFYQEPELVPVLLMIGASYLFVPWISVPAAMLARQLNFRGLFLVNGGGAIANSATALVLAWQGFSSESLAIAMIVQSAVRMVVAQILRPTPVPLVPMIKGSGHVLAFGGKSTVLFVAGALGVRSPDLIVGRILGTMMVGIYSRSYALAGQLHMLVVGAVGSIFYPAFARLRDEGEPLGPHYERVVAMFGALVWPAMALLAILSEPVILALYGPVWADAAPLLVWMALGEMCFVMLPMHLDLPILMGQMNRVIRVNLIDTCVAIITLIIMAHWGLIYAAMARLVYGCIWVLIYARFMHEIVGFSWRNMIKIYLHSGLLAAITVLPVVAGYQLWRGPAELGFDGLMVLGLAGVALWFTALMVLRHPARDEVLGVIGHVLQAARDFITRPEKP